MAALFADEDFSQHVVDELIRLGDDALTVRDAGLANQRIPDSDDLDHATQAGRIVLTHNRRHYIQLHGTTPVHAGIVVCTRDDSNPLALAGRIHLALAGCPSMVGQLLRVNRPSRSSTSP